MRSKATMGAPAVGLEGVAPAAAAQVEQAVARLQPEPVEVDGQHRARRAAILAVLLDGGLGRGPPCVPLEHPGPAGRAEAGPQGGVVEGPPDGARQRAGVVGRHEQGGVAVGATTSGSAPPVVATSGTPHAMASMAGSENPS